MDSNREIFLKNTPLQNLKNILSDADTVIQSRVMRKLIKNSEEQPIEAEKKGVLKSALQQTANDLAATPGQYISSASLSRTVCKLCAEDTDINVYKDNYINSNINIINLKRLLSAV